FPENRMVCNAPLGFDCNSPTAPWRNGRWLLTHHKPSNGGTVLEKLPKWVQFERYELVRMVGDGPLR
ncbi:MAG: hypothetical protein ACKN94_12720, partial [Pirellulaceae bacterium]